MSVFLKIIRSIIRLPLKWSPFFTFSLLLAFQVLAVCPAQASYFMATQTGNKLDLARRTHVFISGRGNDLGTAPEYSAAVKAKKTLATFPNDQILLIIVQSSDTGSSESILTRFGFGNVHRQNVLLDSKQLMNELTRFSQIASIDAFGHSGIIPGVYLDGVGDNDLKWLAYDPQSSRLTGHFTADAFAVFNGCNVGHLQAPVLSKIWGIPVAATLTSTHFETLFNDGFYYWDNADKSADMVADYNSTLRMRPDNSDYAGHFGHYEQGLPFFKFFCVGIPEARCLSAMAHSVLTDVSSFQITAAPTLDQYLQVVREWICPSAYTPEVQGDQAECMSRLAHMTLTAADRTYSPFPGHLTQCTFNGCYPARCETSSAATTACAMRNPGGREATTFVDEYLAYLKAYPLLGLK